MMKHKLNIRWRFGAAASALAVFSANDLAAQSLAQRVANAPDGRVQFSFPVREGACGDGRTYMRLNWSTGSSEYYGNINSNNMPDCVKGPARVVLEQAARTVIGIRTFVGPLEKPEGVTDLGIVSAKEVSDYLLGLAAKAEGSVSGSAIMPAMIAEGVDNQAALLAIARDQSRARETRRSAITYLSRDGRAPTSAAQPLLAIATDETDNQSVRQQALRTLSRLEGGSGIPELIRLAGDRQGGWTAREALSSLAASGDPRSREFLRGVVRRGELPDDAMATAVRSLGQQYATGTDVALIRESWPKLTGQRSQEAALSAITDFPYISSVNREYNCSITATGVYNATMRLHYLDSELEGNDETIMTLWKYSGSWASAGKSANDYRCAGGNPSESDPLSR